MSSVFKVSVSRGQVQKEVLNERNKSTMGTNYAAASKSRIAVKRNMTASSNVKETINDNASSISGNKIRKYDKTSVRSKTQLRSSENYCTKNALNEKKSKPKSIKAEVNVEKHVLSDDVRTRSNEENAHDSLAVNAEEGKIPEMSESNNPKDAITLSLTNNNEERKFDTNLTIVNSSTNKTCYVENKESEINSVSDNIHVLSDTTDLPKPENEITKSSFIPKPCLSEDFSVANSRTRSPGSESCDNETNAYCSVNRKKTLSKCSIPKLQSVIIDSCDSEQTDFKLSDVNKDNIKTSNVSEPTHQESAIDSYPIENAACKTRKTHEKLTSSNGIAQPQTIPTKDKVEMKNTQIERKAVKPSFSENIPNYLRMTSSAANKEIKKNSDKPKAGNAKQRSVTRENPSKSNHKQIHTFIENNDGNKSKCESVKKDWQTGLRSSFSFKHNEKKGVAKVTRHDEEVHERNTTKNVESESPNSGEMEFTCEVNPNSFEDSMILSEKKDTVSSSNENEGVSFQNVPLTVQDSNSHTSYSPKKLQSSDLPLNSQMTRNFEKIKCDKQKIESKSDSKSKLTIKKGEKTSSRSHSSVSRMEQKTSTSVLSLRRKCKETSKNVKTIPKFTDLSLKRENDQRKTGTVSGLNSRSQSMTPEESKPLSLSLKRQESADNKCRSSKSRSTTPDDSSDSTNSAHTTKSESQLKKRLVVAEQHKQTSQDTKETKTLPSSTVRSSNTNSQSKTSRLKRLNLNTRATSKVHKIEKEQSFKNDLGTKLRSSTQKKPTSLPSSDIKKSHFSNQTKPKVKSKVLQKDSLSSRDSKSRSRSNTPALSNTSSSSESSSSRKTEPLQKDRALSRGSDTRSRSTTPGAASSSSSCSNASSVPTQSMINLNKDLMLKGESKSRSATPDLVPASVGGNKTFSKGTSTQTKPGVTQYESQSKLKSTNKKSTTTHDRKTDNVGCKQVRNGLKQAKMITDETVDDSNIKSKLNEQKTKSASGRPTHKGNRSTSKQSILNSKQTLLEKDNETENELLSLSTSTTSSASSESSQMRQNDTTSDSKPSKRRLRQNPTTERKDTQDSDLRVRPFTSQTKTTSNYSNHSLKSTLKTRTTITRQNTSERFEQNRKSRSRSSTPGDTAVSSSNTMSVKQRNNKGAETSGTCKLRKNAKSETGQDSDKTTQIPVLEKDVNKKKVIQEDTDKINLKKRNPKLQNQSQMKYNAIAISVRQKAKFDKTSQHSNTSNSSTVKAQSSITTLDSQQQVKESCNTLSTVSDISDSSKSESEVSELLGSQNISSNSKHELLSVTNDKPIVKPTKLSIKPQSSIKAGKMHTLDKNKKSNIVLTSSENRTRLQKKDTSIQKKVNKTLVSDNKSRKTESLAVIKRNSISTKFGNKSGKRETFKQKSQLAENFTSSNVNFDSKTQGVYNFGELIGEGNCLTKDENGRVCINGSKVTDENIDTLLDKTDQNNPGSTKISTKSLHSEGVDNNFNDNECLKTSSTGISVVYTEKRKSVGMKDETDGIGNKLGYYNCKEIDLEATAHDPKTKVTSNCLSDVRENEQQRVNCETYTEITRIRNETINSDCILSGKQAVDVSKNMDITQSGNENNDFNMELIHSKPCSENDMTLTGLCENRLISQCALSKDDFQETVEKAMSSAEKKSLVCDAEMSFGDANCLCDMTVRKVENENKTDYTDSEKKSVLKFSQDLSSLTDKHIANSTFEIDACDVNSSNQMPISKECAFKHTTFSDSKRDKSKCTDAVPVTGAVSFQTTNKRQDKKISSSLSHCEKRNTALLSNKNGFVHISDRDIVSDASIDINRATPAQVTKDIKKRQDNDGGTLSTTKLNTGGSSEIKLKHFEDSSVPEQILSDWQNSGSFDGIISDNESKLQVINKCETNKGTSEPENSCGKLKGVEDLSRDNMYAVQDTSDKKKDLTSLCKKDIYCGKMCDLNFEQIEISEKTSQQHNTTQGLLQDVTFEQESFNTILKDDGSCMHVDNKSEMSYVDNEGKISEQSENLKNEIYDKRFSVEEIHLQNVLTCVSEIDENITYHAGENSSPEQDLRSIDAKQINTEHDLSLHASYTPENISQTSSEICHTELELISYSKCCESKQYPVINDKGIEIVSNYVENDMNDALPSKQFIQNQFTRFVPDSYLSETELKNVTAGKPSVLDVQEKQTNCFDFSDESESLFSQQAITEDGLIMSQYENVNEFQEQLIFNPGDGKSQDKGKRFFPTEKMSKNINRNDSEFVQNENNRSFFTVPKLSYCICEMYPNLKSKNKACSKLGTEKEINHQDIRCSNTTQSANLDTCSFNMKLNDSACLFQSYKHSQRDDIKVSPECFYCTDLSQTPEHISNSYSKKLHSQNDLNEENSSNHGTLKNTGNKLCTGSMPRDGIKIKISPHITLTESTEYQDLNDLSLLFDDDKDINSRGTMSRDSARAPTEGTVILSELSAEMTDNRTLKTHKPNSYQDDLEDKPSGELSAFKISTQKSSCNLVFSEKSNEPKDHMLRYEQKNSAGNKKFYSCKDELDTGIASTQEENNFRNLAAIRDEDINYEIKSNHLNLETPPHCDSSLQGGERVKTKGDLKSAQGQCSGGETKFSVSSKNSETEHSDLQGGSKHSSQVDILEFNTQLSPVEDLLSKDIRLSSVNPEHSSDKDNRHNQNTENGILLDRLIKPDISQTDAEANGILTFNKKESISKLNLTECSVINESIENESEIENQKTSDDEICDTHFSDLSLAVRLQPKSEESIVITTATTTEDIKETAGKQLENRTNELSTNKNDGLLENEQQVEKELGENNSPLDDVLSDTSEAFIDAEDTIAQFPDKLCKTHEKYCDKSSSDLNISCGASTSTESFVDAVENLDDEYLTSTTNSRNSREFHNEEILSQASSSAYDSSTSIAGSMDDLSGWEEFSENIEDINDFNGDMETKRLGMTSIKVNSQNSLPVDQSHTPVCLQKRVLHDKSYQSQSPSSEATEIYLSKIKTNSLRYKDMKYGEDQNIIRNSISDTGNGGTLKDSDVKGVGNEDGLNQSTKSKTFGHCEQTHNSATALHNTNITKSDSTGNASSSTGIKQESKVNISSEKTGFRTTSAVGSKIEAAVLKRTERRRRRQIEQQKVDIAKDSKDDETSAIKLLSAKNRDKHCNNESIEKCSCLHSAHFRCSCSVSDNMTFSYDRASGTQELSQQIHMNLNLNGSNLEQSKILETPLNHNYEDYITKEVSISTDTTNKAECNLIDRKNEIILTSSGKHLDESGSNGELSKHATDNNHNDTCQKDTSEDSINNEIHLSFEFVENVQKKDADFDDIEFIDADDTVIDVTEIEHKPYGKMDLSDECGNETKFEKQISPNVSFTFSFEEETKEDFTELQIDEINDKSSTNNHCLKEINIDDTKTTSTTQHLDHVQSSHEEEMVLHKDSGNLDLTINCDLKTSVLHDNKDVNKGHPESMVCDTKNDLETSTDSKIGNIVDPLQEAQLNCEESSIHADICEESNISVQHALELERKKLANNDNVRSRKGLFISKRSDRRATVDSCSFDNTDEDDLKEHKSNEGETTKNTIKKSKSFREVRKQISPMASFMNPPEQLDATDDKNETVEPINKKVSDICKSFMTKTRASVQRTRAKPISKSPAPHRKLMKWINNQGKWMRIPVDEIQDNKDDDSKSRQISCEPEETSTQSKSTLDEEIHDYTIATPNIKTIDKDELLTKQSSTSVEIDPCKADDTTEANSRLESTDKDISVSEKNSTTLEESSCSTEVLAEAKNKPPDSQSPTIKNTDTNKVSEEIDLKVEIVSLCNNEDVTSSSETILEIHEVAGVIKSETVVDEDMSTETKHSSDAISMSKKRLSKTDAHINIDENTKPKKTNQSLAPCIKDADTEVEMKVVGTTLDDPQCNQEKHLKRQELLFGLLDSYNRRKPRRFTRHETNRDVQSTFKSQSNDIDSNKELNASIDSSSDKTNENVTDNTQCIPKIKAVKIQEEVFECKTEYLKDTNLSQISECDSSLLQKRDIERIVPKDERGIGFKAMTLPIRKSKTFSGLGDVERRKHVMNTNVQTKTNISQTFKERTYDTNVNMDKYNDVLSDKNDNSKVPSVSGMTDKRCKAGLKLDLDKAHSGPRNDTRSNNSPSRLGPDQSRGRPSGDRSPNRLSVDQPKVRLRSPEKGPRQGQRSKLLSEIVEVEESKEDSVLVTCDRRQQQRYYSDRQRQEGQKPVTRSNKRRSLSLPTGTLAFGDARIVYKNGHFTIETMDNSEYDSSQPGDYHSSSRHLDGNEDDMWDMPDTSEDNSRVKSNSREVTDTHDRPLMRRQNARAALQSSDSTEDVFYTETEFEENVSPYKQNLSGEYKVLKMGQTNEETFNESCSSRTSDMSVDSYSSERTDLSTDDSVTDVQKLSSSSLPDRKDEEVKRVMQRAKRTSSFRAAQEGGSMRLSGIEEDMVHNSSRARSVSLDESQNSDLSKSPKIQNVQNQNPTFLKKVMAKRKTRTENLNISSFTKQSESAREFFTKKMTLKGLFRKNKSDSAVNSPIKTEHPVSPPIATFQDDDIGSVDTPPGSPYRNGNIRRRHTSADILKTYPDSSETDSNCPTPTQERSSKLSHFISSPSTPSHEANSFFNLSSHSAQQYRDDDEMSITSGSSFASSIHSPPLEQPHKPKTPKPVGASPRRYPSVGSQLSRSGSQSSQRNVINSVTSLDNDQYDTLQDESIRDHKCECGYKSGRRRSRSSTRSVKGSSDSLTMCQFCKQTEFYKNDSAFSSSSFNKQQATSREKLDEESARLRKDSSGRSNFDRLGIISQADVVSSNSNDSGIQRDASVHSSNESIKGTPESRVRLRRNKSLSPHPDRPKSEIGVRWADGDSGDYDITESPVKLRNKTFRDKPRPKSDLDGSSFLSERMKAFGSEINLQPYCSLRSLYEMKRHDLDRQKNRRMSTPHPIKSRLQRAPQKVHKQPTLVRSNSMPESLEKIHKRRKMHHLLDFHLDSLSRHMDIDDLSDESDLSFDQASLQERSISVQSSSSHLTAMDEDEDNLTYAEALWDHITMDPEELGFRAQDVIEVLDMADKDWWFGVIEDREGWFPATFVRIRVNQDQLEDDLDLDATIQDNLTTSPKLRRISMFNKNQARTNVVNEIINAEREYVKHLKDVVEGYIQHARKRTEMFPEERIALIFGNLEKIYSFAQKFVSQLEMCIDVCPHLSEIGQCFLDNDRGFEIYSDYCNNHPSACEELDELCKDSKYKHFFEACRLLQELVEIPLEGFLLTPVQKICKYPLQLAELLKYTPPDHADYMMVKDALAAMRKIATLINERKRKMESIEKIAVWQHSVVDWEGPDLLEGSSELIFSGELNKINTAGWSQERFFFLFDHQLVYCKKELLKRHVFSYKGRLDLDHCDIIDVPDGKDSQYNVTVKHAWKFHETLKDKCYLVYAKSEAVKQSWLKALRDERQRVLEDQENDFCVPDHWKQTVLNKVRSQSHLKDKQSGGRASHGQLMLQKDLKDFTYATLPRHRISQKHDKKKGWFKFGGGKKSKR